ncbi:kinase-like protein [Coniophora puteana RWD-64-598 SS2]|uniref:Kinase-like protein n=1 Tax=Coniophora puteana (strain RWD-64-598) TaxID=741705 RepID=A0A5M3MX68_CONPW|nr:kinase-like protein [Coniophora puteana RWD-64-598 SS2]EIW83743.1 kinase-like protein [Coniophora puteana RWD-64-598 SS2]
MSAAQGSLAWQATAKTFYEGHQATQHANSDDPQLQHNEVWGVLHPFSASVEPIELSKKVFAIGRSEENDFVLRGNKISGKHCTIQWNGQDDNTSFVMITDTSTNGTWIDGDRIYKDQFLLLKEGSEVVFGRHPTLPEVPELNYRYIYRHTAIPAPPGSLRTSYDIGYEIGRGSFSTVWSGISRSTGKWYAIKFIDTPKEVVDACAEDSESRDESRAKVVNYVREVGILEKLRHKNICQLEEVFYSEWKIFLEYVDGGDLWDYIHDRVCVDEATTGGIMFQAVDALAMCIFHRDLKPDNILLTSHEPPVVKIADFGLSKVVDNTTFLKTMCGTASYIAPEVLTQEKQEGYDHLVDSWSIGVTVYTMLTGNSPFVEDSSIEDLKSRIIARTIYWENLEEMEISKDADDFIRSLLQKLPIHRLSLSNARYHKWLVSFEHSQPEHETPRDPTARSALSETASDLQHELSVEKLLAGLDG